MKRGRPAVLGTACVLAVAVTAACSLFIPFDDYDRGQTDGASEDGACFDDVANPSRCDTSLPITDSPIESSADSACGSECDTSIPITDSPVESSADSPCVPPAQNTCFECLDAHCCPQITGCDVDPACKLTKSCYINCYLSDQGSYACWTQCNSKYPSGQVGSDIFNCAVQNCQGTPCP
jgi:hypothetical protein